MHHLTQHIHILIIVLQHIQLHLLWRFIHHDSSIIILPSRTHIILNYLLLMCSKLCKHLLSLLLLLLRNCLRGGFFTHLNIIIYMLIGIYISVHLYHPRVEIRTSCRLTWVVAYTTYSYYVQQTHQHGDQTSKTHYTTRTTHEILKCIMTVLQVSETVYIKKHVPISVHWLISLKRR